MWNYLTDEELAAREAETARLQEEVWDEDYDEEWERAHRSEGEYEYLHQEYENDGW